MGMLPNNSIIFYPPTYTFPSRFAHTGVDLDT